MHLLILALAVLCAHATPQYTKTGGVKGGYSGQSHQYHGGENLVNSYYSNSSNQYHGYGGYGVRTNLTESVNYEKGVCYIEVPTASLVRDPAHVPAGNGSRPDLSRIRSCCSGYTRNIHNYRLCDPVCTHECINGLCSAPDTCTCYPDHVKNLAGICVATCPIGCQNGQCAGGECICKDGYRLDYEGRFCVPYCREQCGGPGRGNCTAPNTCECKPGFRSTPEGSCIPTNAPNLPPSPTTTQSPYGQRPNYNNQPYGQQPQYPNYPSNQPSSHPGNQPSNQPGNPPPYYPGGSQSNYPGSPQYQYPGYPYPSNPGSQNQYPGYQPTNNTGNPQYNRPGTQQPNYPGNQYNSSHPRPSDTSVRPPYDNNPYNPGNQQPIYYNVPSNLYPSLTPDSQHLGPDQRPIPGSSPSNQTIPNGGAYYPNSQYYPGSQYYPDQHPSSNSGYQPYNPPSNAEPLYPNSQYNPGQQNYPYNQQNQPNQPQYPSQSPGSGHYVYPSQHSDVEMLCSKPCVNGTCVARDTCACNTGYLPIGGDTSRCEPNCSGCSNGVCVSPYVCQCNPGYYKDFSVKGRTACVRRVRRSADTSAPVNIAELLVFEIPEDYIE